MIRILFAILGMFFYFNLLIPVSFAEALPDLTAKSAIVIEAQTGKVLYDRDSNSRRYPASTTKMMTLIVALENAGLNEIVTASKTASETEGSSIWLENGEKMALEDLLYAIMLVSGNDATVAVAEHIAGSVPKFAALMNQKAKAIGANDTNFVNSSGLPDNDHYSTAHDLAKIAAYGYKNPLFEKIIATKEKIIPWAQNPFSRSLDNENRMLWLYDGGNGVKTGYTEAAGRCLVSGAKRDGIQLIAVVLDSTYMWNDSIALLNYGFSKVHKKLLYTKDEVVGDVNVSLSKIKTIPLMVAADIYVPIIDGEEEKFNTVIDIPDRIDAPIAYGQKIGQIKIMQKDNVIVEADLLAGQSAEKKSFFFQLYRLMTNGFSVIKEML